MGMKHETLNAGKTKIHIMSTNKHIKFVWAFYLSKAKGRGYMTGTRLSRSSLDNRQSVSQLILHTIGWKAVTRPLYSAG